jgi:hypothetical protein
MREIFIKTTTSSNHKRKNLSIVEVIDQNGYVARAEKKYCYYVSEQGHPLEKLDAAAPWNALQGLSYRKKDRHVSIRKTYDYKNGSGQMVYRVIGSFYVVQDLHLFAVVFMHTIKFDMLNDRFPAPGGLTPPENRES